MRGSARATAIHTPLLGGLLLCVALLLAVGCTPGAPGGERRGERTGQVDRGGLRPGAGGAATAPSQPLRTARMGFVGKTLAMLPLAFADEYGILAEEGLQLEPIVMSSATLQIAAVVNGDTDYFSGIGGAVRASLQGMPVKGIVAGESNTAYTLLARPDVRGIAGLKGGKLGTSGVGTGDWHVLAELLKRNGLDPQNDAAMLSIGGTNVRYTALVNGSIDAGLLAPPASILAEKEGMRVLAEPQDLMPYPSAGLSTTDMKLANARPEVKSMVRAYVRALERIHTDRDATVRLIQDYMEMEPDVAQATYDFAVKVTSRDGTAPAEGIRLVVDIERSNLGFPPDSPANSGLDFSLVDEVNRELRAGSTRR